MDDFKLHTLDYTPFTCTKSRHTISPRRRIIKLEYLFILKEKNYYKIHLTFTKKLYYSKISFLNLHSYILTIDEIVVLRIQDLQENW